MKPSKSCSAHEPSTAGEGALVVEFANTTACDACGASDALATPAEYARWARGHPWLRTRTLSPAELARLRSFRSALLEILRSAAEGVAPKPPARIALNDALQHNPARVELGWVRGSWTLRRSAPGADPVGWTSGRLAAATAELLTGLEAGHLKRCEGRGCSHVLLARTRTQRWCSSTGCGNRARVARHYRRSRTASRRRAGRAPK